MDKLFIKQLKLVFLIFLFFLTSIITLLYIPKVINLAQNKVTQFSSLNFKSYNLVPEVAGVVKVAQTEIVDTGMLPPKLTSAAVLALDFDSGKILYQKNIHQRLPPASTTKLMTALVAIEHFAPGDVLTVFPEALVEGSTMGLNLNEKISFRGLLYGMLMNSGNDAAYTIALNYPGGMENFVAKMNEKANFLGLTDTHFQNPAGFDALDHYSSAFDLGVIANQAAINPTLTRIFATKETTVLSLDQIKPHILKNLNQLLDKDGVIGIKTGYTEKSGENLVGLVDRHNRKVLTVVLNSDDRFGETEALMNWVYSNFIWRVKY